jgi:hypothetical protein
MSILQLRGNTSPAPKQVDAAMAAAIKKTRKPVRKFDKNGKPKAAKAMKKAKAHGNGPSGFVADIVKLASRPSGVSRAELIALTKWHGAPWKWLFKNPKGTGYCDRWGYTLRIAEGKDGEVRYCTTKR